MSPSVPLVSRLWAVVRRGESGRATMTFSAREPECDGMDAALLLQGKLAGGDVSYELNLVSDPKADPDLTGPDGPNGWTPVLVPVGDGTRTLLKVADWVRSAGKPATGYLTASGALSANKVDAFNLNAIKRVDIFTAVSGSDGIATIVFDPPFASVPAKALPQAMPNLLAGPVKAEVVADSLTKSGCKVKVSSAALVTGAVAALAGATASVIVIEA